MCLRDIVQTTSYVFGQIFFDNVFKNLWELLSVPMDLPYCLVYPMRYMKDMELDHFDTRNNPAGTCLHCCICHATLQYMNDDPRYHRAYDRSWLILPRGTQYKEQLFPKILKPWNHQVPLIDPITKEPYSMKLMGDFRSMDPIFKGCYGDSFLYSNVDLGQLQQQGYTFPLIRVKFLPHQFLPICRPNSLRLQSGPHHGPRCPLWQPNLQRPSTPAGRVGITTVQDVA